MITITTESPPINPQTVRESADRIQTLLNSEGVLEVVTQAEIAAATKIITDLDARTADGVVDELNRRGLLDDFARELVDDSFVGPGVSASDRTTIYASLAKRLDGATLAAFADQVRASAIGVKGEQYFDEVNGAIGAQASPAAKQEYIDTLTTRLKPGATEEQRRVDRQSIAETFASMNDQSAALRVALQRLTSAGLLEDVLSASVRANYRTPSFITTLNPRLATSSQTSVTYDTSRFERIMQGVEKLSDPALKARVFDEGVDAMRAYTDGGPNRVAQAVVGVADLRAEAAAKMASALTKVLDSDTTGVMRELERHDETKSGAEFMAYAKQMLLTGQEKKLGELMARLQIGNNKDRPEDPVARFARRETAKDGGIVYQNAETLGYFVGSIYAATASISADVRRKQDMINNFMQSALTIVDKFAPGGKKLGEVGASLAKDWVSSGLQALNDDKLNVAQALDLAAPPSDPQTGRDPSGSGPKGAYENRVTQIERLNRQP